MKRQLLLLSLFAAPAAAQEHGLSGSESYTMLVRALPSQAGRAASANYEGALSFGLTSSGDQSASASYSMTTGIMAGDGTLGAGPPLVFALDPPMGTKDGGDAVSVIGANLQGTQGPTTVFFDGTPVVPLTTSETLVTLQTPIGVNNFGNPLGQIDVDVSHMDGSTTKDDGYVFKPAMLQDTPAQVGQSFQLSLEAEPGDFYVLYLGISQGIGIPLKNIDGALEILPPLFQLSPLSLTATGHKEFTFPLPDDGSLAGVVLEFQNIALTSLNPLAGSFTNKLDVLVEL